MGIPLPKSPLLEPAFALPPVRTIPSRGPMPPQGRPASGFHGLGAPAVAPVCFVRFSPWSPPKKCRAYHGDAIIKGLAEMGKLRSQEHLGLKR